MRLLLVVDRPLVAEGLAKVLGEVLEASQVTPTTVEDALTWLPGRGAAVAVVELDRPACEQRYLCEQMAAVGVPGVFFVGGAEDGLLLLESGAAGIVTYAQALPGVVEAVRTVGEGNTYVPAPLLGGVLQGLIRERRRLADRPRGLETLSTREREVLEQLAAGYDVIEIAGRLVISPETAKTHIRHVLNKLGARSRVEAVALAVDAGLVPEGSRR